MLDQGRVEAPFLYLICLLIPFLLRGEEGEDDVWSFGQIEILQDDSDSADGLCSGTFFFFAAWYEFFVESAIVLFVILGGGVHISQLQLQFKDYAPCYLITANNRYPETNT